MDRLTLLETFAIALDEGSINRAAQRRGLTQSAASQQIKSLETLLGHALMLRTPRGVRATRAGELVYAHAQNLLGGYDRLTAELDAQSDQISGRFKVSTSRFMAQAVLGPMLMDLDTPYPDLNIVMRIEDRLVDVVRENYDLAIRTGSLGDTDGVGRKIAELETVLFATPAYLDRVGRPSCPQDMQRLKYIQHHEDHTMGYFPLTREGATYQAPIRVGFTADDTDLIMHAVTKGAGYSRAPRLLVQAALTDGTYEKILPGYTAPNKDIFAVYPSRHALDRRHEVVINGFLERLRDSLQADTSALLPPGARSPLDVLPAIS
ncbi:LysR family transcriptional regulator [Phaeobacter porticola]|uniref:Transcriptional regulator, LysR family n=1 Tax=Phaeobacter porticola TaxID=1844006 RepID=A0A1L3I3N4_9RHOB|nr:LysR family transcriptional regulator [Phaeobacter porticola]APG46745.1 transcriptional regulator, LysR family [Phaeobacter porticola]